MARSGLSPHRPSARRLLLPANWGAFAIGTERVRGADLALLGRLRRSGHRRGQLRELRCGLLRRTVLSVRAVRVELPCTSARLRRALRRPRKQRAPLRRLQQALRRRADLSKQHVRDRQLRIDAAAVQRSLRRHAHRSFELRRVRFAMPGGPELSVRPVQRKRGQRRKRRDERRRQRGQRRSGRHPEHRGRRARRHDDRRQRRERGNRPRRRRVRLLSGHNVA
jgi:hypothetical protein